MRNPPAVLDDIEAVVQELRQDGMAYSDARREQAKREIAYEKAIGAQMVRLYDEFSQKGARLPAEDMRKALVHIKIDEDIWAQHLMAKARAESLDRSIRVKQSVLSGLQSELAQMRAEYQHA